MVIIIGISLFKGRQDVDHVTFIDHATVFIIIAYIVIGNKHRGSQVV